MLTRRKLSCKN